jgi:queuosine precursor transporter
VERKNAEAGMGLQAIVILGAYVSAQLIANIGSLKIVSLAGLSLDAGTFIYPVTFTLRDLLHKRLGKGAAVRTILFSGAANLVMSGYLAFVCALPPDPSWTLDAAFAAVLGPVWRIVCASIAAQVLSELVDTQAYQFWVSKVTERYQWSRVLFSNALSVPADSLIFSWGAFAFSLPVATVWSIFAANVLVKFAVTLVSLPWIYLVRGRAAGEPGAG